MAVRKTDEVREVGMRLVFKLSSLSSHSGSMQNACFLSKETVFTLTKWIEVNKLNYLFQNPFNSFLSLSMAVNQIELSLKFTIEVDQALLEKLTYGLAEQYIRLIIEELNRDGADVDRTCYRVSFGNG